MWSGNLPVRLALLILASFAGVSSAGEDDGAAVVQRFFRAYAEGSELAPFWAADAPARNEFEKAARATLRTRCIELHAVRVDDLAVRGDDSAAARVSLLLTKRERAGGRTWGPAVVDYRVALVRERGEWRVREAATDGAASAVALIAAKSDGARREILTGAALTPELVRALVQSAIAATNIPDLAEALRIAAIAEEIAVQIGDEGGRSLCLSLHSIVARTEKRQEEARARALEAVEIARRLDDPDVLARALISAGRVYAEPNSADGVPFFREAAALENRVENLSLMSRAAIALHLDAWRTNNYVVVRSENEKAMKFAEMSDDATGKAAAMHGLANLYDELGQFAPCAEYARRAAELFRTISPGSSYLASLFVESRCRYQDSDERAADELLDRALGLAREWHNEIQEALALAERAYRHLQKGKHADAERLAKQAVALTRKNRAAPNGEYFILAESLIAQRRYAEVLDIVRAIRAERWWSPNLELSLRTFEARAHRGLGDTATALADLNVAIEASEQVRGRLPGDEQQLANAFGNQYMARQAYEESVDLYVHLGRIEDALRVAEQAKGRVLLDALSGVRRRGSEAMTADELRQKERLESEIAALNRRIARTEDGDAGALRAQLARTRGEYDGLELLASTRDPRLRAQQSSVAVASLRDLAGAVPAGGVLVEYVIGEARTYAFVVASGPGGPVLHCRTIPIGRKALQRKITAYREQLAARSLTHRLSARKLDALLFAPLAGSAATVGIVPDGVLWQLPFETLIDARGRYRLERHTIYYAPSMSVLRKLQRAPQSHTATACPIVLAVGDPLVAAAAGRDLAAVYRSIDLSPLPDARVEVEKIRAMYGPDAATVFVGTAATEARVKADIGRYDVLHFATHGILDNASPMYSRIVLAEEERAAGSDADGMLEAWELMKLELHADLVVFSACDSAAGRVSAGEGLIGMTWAAFVGGARTTVASIWKSASRSTAALMVDFHRELLANPSDLAAKAAALRRAKLRMLHGDSGHRHPFYWAPFVVIGDPGNLRPHASSSSALR